MGPSGEGLAVSPQGSSTGFRSVVREVLTPACACSQDDLTVCSIPSLGPAHRGHPHWKRRTTAKLTVTVCSHGKQRNRQAKAVAGESLALRPAACVQQGLSEEAGPPRWLRGVTCFGEVRKQSLWGRRKSRDQVGLCVLQLPLLSYPDFFARLCPPLPQL